GDTIFDCNSRVIRGLLGCRRGRFYVSATAEMLVEVDHLRALLEADNNAEIGALAAAERDRFFDVIGDARTLLRRVKGDAYGERPLAEDRLIGAGHGYEILKVDRIGFRGRAAFADHDDVQDHSHRVAGILALDVGLANQ